MATLGRGKTFSQPSSGNTATDLNNLVDLATIQDVGALAGEIAAAAIETGKVYKGRTGTANASTPALRVIGTGANDAAAGNTAGIATSLQFGSNTAIPLDTANPTTGQFVRFDGTKFVGATPSSTAAITGTGTVSSSSASPTITGVGTKFLTEVGINYLFTIGSVTWRVTAIASDTSLTVNANWGANNSGQAFTFVIAQAKRPWGSITAKTTTFSAAITDAGVLFKCDTSGGAYAGTLPAASGFSIGDTVAFIKTTDDANAMTVTCAGSDAFVDASTTFPLKTIGASLTCQSDGVSQWKIVSSTRIQGQLIQSVRSTDTAQQTINKTCSLSNTPTTSNTGKVAPLSVTITPKSAFTTLRLRGLITGAGNTAGQRIVIAIFNSSTLVAAFASCAPQGPGTFGTPIELEVTSGGTSAITFDVYIGTTSGSYFYLGDSGSGASLFGANVTNFFSVSEVAI